MKTVKYEVITYLAYVLLLVTFVSLGIFIAALALGGGTAGAAAVATAVALTLSIVGFRAAAAMRARAVKTADYRYKVNIWTRMVPPDQLDRYRANYRGERDEAQERLVAPPDVDQVDRPEELRPAAKAA